MSNITTRLTDNIDKTRETITMLSEEVSKTDENIKSFGVTSKSTKKIGASSDVSEQIGQRPKVLLRQTMICFIWRLSLVLYRSKVKERNGYMNKKIIKMLAVFAAVLTCVLATGCTEAERAKYNVQKQADNFNVTRRLSVINARTDKPMLAIIGNFSLSNNENKELVVTIEVEPNVYKVDYVYLNDWTMYTVEDISGAYVDKYHYEINFLPEMILPVSFTSKD